MACYCPWVQALRDAPAGTALVTEPLTESTEIVPLPHVGLGYVGYVLGYVMYVHWFRRTHS